MIEKYKKDLKKDRLTKLFAVRLTEDEFRQVKNLSQNGFDVAFYVRDSIRKFIKKASDAK